MTDMTSVTELLNQLATKAINFNDVLTHINSHYQFTASAFDNGNVKNSSEENQGSCRVLSFAKLHQLNKEQTLSLFAEHYQNVLDTPNADNHQNIRQFMQHGWAGVTFANTNVLLPSA